MKLKLKHFVAFIALFSIVLILYGFHLQDRQPNTGNQYIGLGTIGLFLIAMPLFLIKESSGKSIKRYMFTQENLEKMKSDIKKNKEKSEK